MLQGGAAVPAPCALGAAGGGSECGALHAVPHLRHRWRTLHLQRQGAPLTDSTTGGSMQRQPPPLPGALVRGLLVSARDPAAAGRLVTATCEEGGSRRDVHVRRQPQVVRHECPSAWPNLVPCALHALIADASLSSPIWTRQCFNSISDSIGRTPASIPGSAPIPASVQQRDVRGVSARGVRRVG